MQSTAASVLTAGLSKLAQKVNLLPPAIPIIQNKDHVLESYHKELNELFDDIENIYNEYKAFCKKLCVATNISVDLSKTRSHFYSVYHDDDSDDSDDRNDKNNDKNNESINSSYSLCTENIARQALKTFHVDVDNDGIYILKTLNEWILRIKALINEIDVAQNLHLEIDENNGKLQGLLAKQQQQKTSDKLSNKINQILSFLFAMNDKLNKLKIDIYNKYQQIVPNKYKDFDAIYCQILESQQYFYDYCDKQMHAQFKTENLLNLDLSQTNCNTQTRAHFQFENMINIENIVENNNDHDTDDIDTNDIFSQVFTNVNHIDLQLNNNLTFDDVLDKYDFDDFDDNIIKYSFAKTQNECYIQIGFHVDHDAESKYEERRNNINMDIIIALDISESMNCENRLEIAKNAISSIILQLKPNDKFAFLTFNKQQLTIHDHDQFNKINTIKAFGDTNMGNGYRKCIDMFYSSQNEENEEKKENKSSGSELKFIMYVTGNNPNINLLQMIHNAQKQHNIYTTFIGIHTKIKQNIKQFAMQINGFNYINLNLKNDINYLQKHFKYIVNPIIFDLNICLNINKIHKIYGKLWKLSDREKCDKNKNEIIHISTLFASNIMNDKIILIKFSPKTTSNHGHDNDDDDICLEMYFQDGYNKQFHHKQVIQFSGNNDNLPYFQTNGIRKAILLIRYVEFMTKWIENTQYELYEEYDEVHQFYNYFKNEMDIIDDKLLNHELQTIQTILFHKKMHINDSLLYDEYMLPTPLRIKLKKWAYFDNLQLKDISTLLFCIKNVLPNKLQQLWANNKDNEIKKMYFGALRLVHPDKSLSRGDDLLTAEICRYIFFVLQNSYNKLY